ncbi:hypothetical protein PBT90_20015 [Algoriphagus halophytocola]|uniref:hypothetical protein n=1 Tax=Algoriphagus halophytocola TaxID=2991499 RepID=UPI0022DD3215|nr:hypothetical protein [Algoriphagus sp. TR-M9]WBL45174.1 hypothetical protein PBT90_20015 [Algoriphagus sp. TR-M9]
MNITIFLTIIGLIIAFLSYRRTFSPPPKHEIDDDIPAFTAKFKLIQTIHLETQQLLKDFIQKHDCGNEKMMEGFTYYQFLEGMEEAFPNSNSDKVLENTLPTLTSKPIVDKSASERVGHPIQCVESRISTDEGFDRKVVTGP